MRRARYNQIFETILHFVRWRIGALWHPTARSGLAHVARRRSHPFFAGRALHGCGAAPVRRPHRVRLNLAVVAAGRVTRPHQILRRHCDYKPCVCAGRCKDAVIPSPAWAIRRTPRRRSIPRARTTRTSPPSPCRCSARMSAKTGPQTAWAASVRQADCEGNRDVGIGRCPGAD